MIFKIISTALTGIGGHYLNKRWDKAALFLSLLIYYCVFCFIALLLFLLPPMVSTPGSSGEIIQHLENMAKKISIVYLSGILVLWLVSIGATIVDGKRTASVDIFDWTKTGMIAAVSTTLISFLLLVSTSSVAISTLWYSHIGIGGDSKQEPLNFSSDVFYEYVYFGGTPSASHKLPAPPTGQGMLKGRFIYEDKPAEGVVLDIVLNSKYRVNKISTDANGFFTVKLPFGDWKINSIETESWPNKPYSGNFTIYHGEEEKLLGSRYSRYSGFQKDGFKVFVGETSEAVHLTLTIRKNIELVWPDKDVTGVNANISSVIKWEPYPLATRYYVEIKNMRREGTTTYYDHVTSKVLSNETAIPLSNLKHVKTNDKKKYEYAVEILAFSEDGSLIAEHSDTFRGGTFVLTDGHILVEDKYEDLFGNTFDEDPEVLVEKMELISLDRRRINAVEVLIDDNMITEAENLLRLVASEYSKGRKEVLSGYILALKGNCLESNRMFEKAVLINPDVCIPNDYRSICD